MSKANVLSSQIEADQGNRAIRETMIDFVVQILTLLTLRNI